MTDGRAAILAVLGRYDFRVGTELALQDAVAGVLVTAGLPMRREVDLGEAGRIDFLVDDVGIELKVSGSDSSLIRQLYRYAAHDSIRSLILVTTRARHVRLATVNFGVPFSIHHAGIR